MRDSGKKSMKLSNPCQLWRKIRDVEKIIVYSLHLTLSNLYERSYLYVGVNIVSSSQLLMFNDCPN